MNFDIESIKQALGTLGATLSLLKQAKDLLPESSQKQELNTAIESAERQLKIAEFQTAQSMGYELCKNHFPPEIMLSKDNKIWKCPKCENEINNSHKPPKYFVAGNR
ncbi:MAG: hypothetical protein HZB50_00605 [Chloroflexi bacterium]|nr:hypothetical protein [Chloroflexota bacterium]